MDLNKILQVMPFVGKMDCWPVYCFKIQIYEFQFLHVCMYYDVPFLIFVIFVDMVVSNDIEILFCFLGECVISLRSKIENSPQQFEAKLMRKGEEVGVMQGELLVKAR